MSDTNFLGPNGPVANVLSAIGLPGNAQNPISTMVNGTNAPAPAPYPVSRDASFVPGMANAAPATASAPAIDAAPDLDGSGPWAAKLTQGLGNIFGAYGQAMTASPVPQGPDPTQLMTPSSTAKSGADAAAAPAGVAPTVAAKLTAAGGGPAHTGMTGENNKQHTVEEMVAANRHLTPLDLQILQGYQKSPHDKITQQLVGASEGMRDRAIQQALARGDPAEIQKTKESEATRHMEFLRQIYVTNPLALAQSRLFDGLGGAGTGAAPTGGMK